MSPPDVRTPGGNRADSGSSKTDVLIFAVAATDDKSKAFATWRAKLAIRGHQLHALADGTFMVSRWNLCRVLADLDAVERFVEQAGLA